MRTNAQSARAPSRAVLPHGRSTRQGILEANVSGKSASSAQFHTCKQQQRHASNTDAGRACFRKALSHGGRARARPPRLVYLLCQCDAIFRQADAKSSAVFNANWHLPPEPEGDALRDDSERDQRGFTCLAENIRKTDRFPSAELADEDISKAALLHLKEPERVLRKEFWQDLLVRNG